MDTTGRWGWLYRASIACGSALAIVPCTQEPTRRLRPFGVIERAMRETAHARSAVKMASSAASSSKMLATTPGVESPVPRGTSRVGFAARVVAPAENVRRGAALNTVRFHCPRMGTRVFSVPSSAASQSQVQPLRQTRTGRLHPSRYVGGVVASVTCADAARQSPTLLPLGGTQ